MDKKNPDKSGGWTPNAAAEQAWKALRMMDDGVLKASDFTGLSRDPAEQVASHAARKKREYDQFAQGQEQMAKVAEKKGDKTRAQKFSDNAKKHRKEGREVAKDVAEVMKGELLDGAGVRDAKEIADNAVSPPSRKMKDVVPDVNEIAFRFTVSVGRMLADDKTSKKLDEIIRYCEHVSDSNVEMLCKALETLSERCRKYAAKIERAHRAKRNVDNRAQASRSRRLVACGQDLIQRKTGSYTVGMARTVSEQLKRAIDRSGLSRHRICQMSGIDQAAMSRFMAGTRALTCDSIDKLCEALKLELVGPILGTKRSKK